MGKRKAAETVGAATGRTVRGVRAADGVGQLVQQKTKALTTSTMISTSAAKVALDDPLKATWLPLGADDASSVVSRLREELSVRAELCARLRGAHAAATKLRGGRGRNQRDQERPTDSIVVGINAVSAQMESGGVRLAIFAKDAWPSACLQHLPLLAHVSSTPICLLADAAVSLGDAIGMAQLDAIGFCAEGEPWQDDLVAFVRLKTPAVGAPPWFAFLPGLALAHHHHLLPGAGPVPGRESQLRAQSAAARDRPAPPLADPSPSGERKMTPQGAEVRATRTPNTLHT